MPCHESKLRKRKGNNEVVPGWGWRAVGVVVVIVSFDVYCSFLSLFSSEGSICISGARSTHIGFVKVSVKYGLRRKYVMNIFYNYHG